MCQKRFRSCKSRRMHTKCPNTVPRGSRCNSPSVFRVRVTGRVNLTVMPAGRVTGSNRADRCRVPRCLASGVGLTRKCGASSGPGDRVGLGETAAAPAVAAPGRRARCLGAINAFDIIPPRLGWRLRMKACSARSLWQLQPVQNQQFLWQSPSRVNADRPSGWPSRTRRSPGRSGG